MYFWDEGDVDVDESGVTDDDELSTARVFGTLGKALGDGWPDEDDDDDALLDAVDKLGDVDILLFLFVFSIVS